MDTFAQELPFLQEIIDTADIILFVIDGKGSITQQDEHIKDMIMRANKKSRTILVANKMDSKVYSRNVMSSLSEFYALGFEEVIPVSAFQEEGINELRDHTKALADKQ
ncbi:hypothetical protein KA013_05165 [Patescibacteria group bacterium]|nr:hypothetical protein [Patescibacteria group bacterium]